MNTFKKKKERKIHYTDFFLLRIPCPPTALGTAQAGEWTAGGGIHTWVRGGFPDTGHFLGSAQEWRSRQLQNKDMIIFLILCNYITSKREVAKFSRFQFHTCSSRCHVGSFPYLFPQNPFFILERTARSCSI